MKKVLIMISILGLFGCSSMSEISTTVGVGTTIGAGPISISLGGFKTLKPTEDNSQKTEEEKKEK